MQSNGTFDNKAWPVEEVISRGFVTRVWVIDMPYDPYSTLNLHQRIAPPESVRDNDL